MSHKNTLSVTNAQNIYIKGIYFMNLVRQGKQLLAGIFSDIYFIKHPPANLDVKAVSYSSTDPVRLTTISLAIERIKSEQIEGSFAEAGVWQGKTSKIIHQLAPDRKYFLFDTFEGFPSQNLEIEADNIDRFKNTNLNIVKQNIGDLNNIVFRVGYFPETAKGLESEKFAFVLLDMDLYQSTKDGLEFFFDRVVPGGYIFLHDYNSPESDWGVSRAVNEFMASKSETLMEIPDTWGSVVIRKNR
jgi:O-methyltransferase